MDGERTPVNWEELPSRLVEWRLKQLEEGMESLQATVDRIEKQLVSYGAVMRFAMGLAAFVGAVVSFVAERVFKG